MKQEQLNRIMKLVRETGDRVVVADNASEEVFVIMSLDEYEDLSLSGDGGWLPGEFDEFNNIDEDDESDENEETDEYRDGPCQCDECRAMGDPNLPFFDHIGDLSEQELTQKINRDIAEWKAAQKNKDEEALAEDLADEKTEEPELVEEKAEKDVELAKKPFGGMVRLGEVIGTEKYLNGDFTEGNRPANGAVDEVDLSDVKEEAPEEEKFYLEPVE